MNNDNRNLILALVLMTAVWFGFSLLFPSKPPQPVQENPPAAAAPVVTASQVLSNPAAPAPPLAATVAAKPREIVVETAKYQAVFSSTGARLIAFELKEYRQEAAADSPRVELVPRSSLREASLRTTATGSLALDADAPFMVERENALLQVAGGANESLIFRHVTASGVEVVKTFAFNGDDYRIDTSLAVRNTGNAALSGTIDLTLLQAWDPARKDSYSFSGPALLLGDSLEQIDVDDLEKGPKSFGQEAVWTSLQSKYFMMAAVPLAGAAEKIRVSHEGGLLLSSLQTPLLTLQAGERRQFDYLLFFGPRDPEQLKVVGHGLDLAINFGWFDLLAKPLFHVLTFFYGYLHNYGWAIILLTVILKLIFWPLTHKSYASMKAMQKLQPEMQKVRDKFKNDKERLNKELMELYKKHSVNPLGGCLPMVVQIPVFFALYKVLLDAIALRHAPFMLWLTDLSAKDPYYITPLLMGASMFIQQKMTPTTADPMQAKIFMFMPVVFTFLFLNFPSGLVVYWLVNNLLTIAQQYYINRRIT